MISHSNPQANHKFITAHAVTREGIFQVLPAREKWWPIPLIIVLLLGAILIFTANSGIAWALYQFL
jgi:hypothetical protein